MPCAVFIGTVLDLKPLLNQTAARPSQVKYSTQKHVRRHRMQRYVKPRKHAHRLLRHIRTSILRTYQERDWLAVHLITFALLATG